MEGNERKRLKTYHIQNSESDDISIYSTESDTVYFDESDSETPSHYSHVLTPRRPQSFLSLPIEIRFLIYQYAFSHSSNWNELIRITVDRDHRTHRPEVLFQGHKPPPPQIKLKYSRTPAVHLPVALLTTSRRLYYEALPVLYSSVILGFASNPTSLTFMLDRFSETARNSIRYLRLYPAPLYVVNGPLGERLSWSVLCAQVSRLPFLKRVNVIYNRVEDLKLNPIEMQRSRYGKWLALINAQKEAEFEQREPTSVELDGLRQRFYDIRLPATKMAET
ncbi:hypothetical protein BJX70DRAFT_132878 [Aspergillus crustosus]